MNRFHMSLAVAGLLVAVSAGSLAAVGYECRQFGALAQDIGDALDAGDTARARRAYDRMEAAWDGFHHVMGLFVEGTQLHELRADMAGLPPLLAEDTPEARSALARLEKRIEALYEEEVPSIWHIL
ncbi:MAG: DUF4363 family protein [Oscillospiraceae bacterium]|nr:DUF4363 family protein [Oscillospiraceae bacterium]